MKIDYCYHTHTFRCGHATGEDEEYVINAIKIGFKRLGFSDHVILPQGFEQLGIRGSYEQIEDYLDSINNLKEKYKDQIEIKVGFEAEYYPEMVDYYKYLLKEKVDYLILGQHCYLKDNKFTWHFLENDPTEYMKKYAEYIIEGLKAGLFKYLCHPDLFANYNGYWNETIEHYSREILRTCADLDIPIEINMTGYRRFHKKGENFGYPNENFFRLSKEYKVKYVIGVDAHKPKDFNKRDLKGVYEFSEKLGLDVEENYKI